MKTTLISVMLAIAASAVFAQTPKARTTVIVPDEATAVSIAEPALIKVYGKQTIDYERPLTATLRDGVWYVAGTLCCPDGKGRRICNTAEKPVCLGGVAVAAIRQVDGKVLSITHGK